MLTPEQKEARRKGIGGSDAAAIVGKSKYKNAYDVYLDKIGEGVEEELNDYMHFGNLLEPVIRDEFSRRTGKKVYEPTETFKHKQYDWMLANVDGIVEGESAILECKTASEYKSKEWGDEDSDDIPDDYLIQCAHYAAVLDVEKVYIAVLIGGNKFKMFEYIRNKQLEENIIKIEKRFWEENVIPRNLPEISILRDSSNIEVKGKVEVDDEIAKLLMTYKELKVEIKALDERVKEIKDKISVSVGCCGSLVDSSGNVLGKLISKSASRFDSKSFKADNEELYSKYMKNNTYLELRA